MMARRIVGVVVGSVALGASLSGCLFAYDAAKPSMNFSNDSSQSVVVVVEGLSDEFPLSVARESSAPYGLDDCQGTGIRVETEDGALIGRVDEQACPDWTLTINEDGTLHYAEDE